MNKLVLLLLGFGSLISGCSSVQYETSNSCLAYHISGDNVTWKPIGFMQDESALYIEIPADTKFIPTLRVMDKEFSQPTIIPYTYNPTSHTLRVEKGYDEYILSRTDVEEFYHDNVAIECLKKIPINTK